MLLWIDNSFFEVLKQSKNANEISNLLIALENLATASAEGKHFVLSDRQNLISLVESDIGLSKRAKTVYERAIGQLTQVGAMKSSLACFASILGQTGIRRATAHPGSKTIELSYDFFLDSHSIQPTCLVTENLTDAEVYLFCSEKVHRTTKSTAFVLSAERVHGGGDTTARSYEEVKNRNRLCLCIVDADKETVASNVGPTASKVVTSDTVNLKATASHLIIGVRTIENLLTLRHMVKSVVGTPGEVEMRPKINFYEQFYRAELWKYFHLKNGIKWAEIDLRKPSGSAWTNSLIAPNLYWQQPCSKISDCTKKNCTCYIAPGLSNMLEKVAACFDEKENFSLDDVADSAKEVWAQLASQVVAWTVASAPLRA